MKSLSDASLLAPYRLIGLQALSVDKATTFFTLFNLAAVITFWAPKTFVFIHSIGFISARGTILVAAAWIIKSTFFDASTKLASSLTSPIINFNFFVLYFYTHKICYYLKNICLKYLLTYSNFRNLIKFFFKKKEWKIINFI